jgi:hypothetical protein
MPATEPPRGAIRNPADAKAVQRDGAPDARGAPTKPALWRRWLGIVLRTAHLAGVTLLGAALLGAPLQPVVAATVAGASGAALLVVELVDGRIRLLDLAGLVSLIKLALLAWMALDTTHATALFWIVLVASAISSHAPRGLRHWRPGG